MGAFWGHFVFDIPRLKPTEYPPTIMGKNEKQCKKSWISHSVMP
jgi:hypothetical protein